MSTAFGDQNKTKKKKKKKIMRLKLLKLDLVSAFSFSHIVLKGFLSQGYLNLGLFGKVFNSK